MTSNDGKYAGGSPASEDRQKIRDRLIALAEEDDRVRAELAAAGELHQGYAPRMEAVHRRNAAELEAILARVGWPGKSLVGEEGASAAWLILQHAIGNPALQRRCLPLLEDAVARGEAEPAQAAYLEDRIRFYERRPQRYGTQFDWDENGAMSPWNLENAEQVEGYRRAVGLEPLADVVRRMRDATRDVTPPDFSTRQAEFQIWRESVGWPITADSLPRLRELCLSHPKTSERLSHGEPAWFLQNKKMFVMYAEQHHDNRVAFWCAAPNGAQEELIATEPDRFFRPPYVGHRGWLGVWLDGEVDWDEVARIVREAYHCVAPERSQRAV